MLNNERPTFTDNKIISGTAGFGGIDDIVGHTGHSEGINRVENIFNLGQIKILDSGDSDLTSAVEYDFSIFAQSEGKFILDYQCTDEQNCTCDDGYCTTGGQP